MKKKIFSVLLAFCMLLPIAFSLACSNKEAHATGNVMSVSLNPQIEFVLDTTNKVVSVTALNDDGNHILSLSVNTDNLKSEFEGLEAKDAIQLFLQIAKDNGYLITGNQEEIEIAISTGAEKLLNSVKQEAEKFLQENNIDVSVILQEITKDDIVDKVKECMKEFSKEELKEKTQKQLVKMLEESRKETSKILNQELKEIYYDLRKQEINTAELESILSSIESYVGEDNIILNAFKDNMANLTAKLEELKTAIKENFISEDSDFYNAKQLYINAKQDLLEKRKELGEDGISELDKLTLASYEAGVNAAKIALESARLVADTAIDLIQAAVDTAYATITATLTQVKSVLQDLGVNFENAENVKEHAKKQFKNRFENTEDFKGLIGHENNGWKKKDGCNGGHCQIDRPEESSSSLSSSVAE